MATPTHAKEPIQQPRIPHPSLLGRIVHPLLENRRSLAGAMSWVGLGLVTAFLGMAIFAPLLSPYNPALFFQFPKNLPPSLEHWMGTDNFGRDVMTRVIWGARTSLAIMAIGVLIAISIGLPLGLYSGYVGGRVDQLLVIIMDSIYAFPGLLLAALVAFILGKGILNLGIAITVIYIPLYYRVTRNQTLSIKQETFVEAARALGARPSTIMLSYILHSVIVSIPVIFSFSAADAILTAAGLSFLGLGLERDVPGDWGLDLSDAQQFLSVGVWWPAFFPGLMIVLLTVGLSLMGEGLNDLINPLLKKERS